MTENFYIGQIFENEYPPEAANFCNNSQGSENACYIKEIESIEGVRRFQITRNELPTEAETKQRQILGYQEYLNDTDWYAVRYAETGTPIPDDIKAARQNARDMISQLRGD